MILFQWTQQKLCLGGWLKQIPRLQGGEWWGQLQNLYLKGGLKAPKHGSRKEHRPQDKTN